MCLTKLLCADSNGEQSKEIVVGFTIVGENSMEKLGSLAGSGRSWGCDLVER